MTDSVVVGLEVVRDLPIRRRGQKLPDAGLHLPDEVHKPRNQDVERVEALDDRVPLASPFSHSKFSMAASETATGTRPADLGNPVGGAAGQKTRTRLVAPGMRVRRAPALSPALAAPLISSPFHAAELSHGRAGFTLQNGATVQCR